MFLLSHALSQVHQKGARRDNNELEWEDSQKSRVEEHATNHDSNKLRSDDNDSRNRGVSCGDLARHILHDSPFFTLSWNLSDGEASFGPLDDNGGGADCVSSIDEAVQMLSYAGVDGALERNCLHDR